jgi:D-serine deaminase-like pyridoxal phosphate-dependent protein
VTGRRDLLSETKAALDTPALLVDLDVMAGNIDRIARTCREHGVRWRPHTKGQKTPEIIRMELAAGARGITCAKVGEAEAMVGAGIGDILIANEIVGELKVRRLVELLARADITVAIDNRLSVAELGDAAAARGRRLGIVIEVDIGMHRAGVQPGSAVVELANAAAGHPGLAFRGVMGWESQAVTIADAQAKEKVVVEAVAQLTASAAACSKAGHRIEIVSCGGTGTFPYCIQQPGVTEVQVGGGIFSDMHYMTHYHADFAPALTILATVISRPTPTRLVLDAGRKTMSGDSAMPQPIGLPAQKSMRLSAEHSTIELEVGSETPRVGDKIELIVGYSDTTVHLHEEIVGIRSGRIEGIWRVLGRGKIK